MTHQCPNEGSELPRSGPCPWHLAHTVAPTALSLYLVHRLELHVLQPCREGAARGTELDLWIQTDSRILILQGMVLHNFFKKKILM